MHLGPHPHDCQHTHQRLTLSRAFALAVVLNVLLVIGEAVAGFVSGSLALLADAGHNLSDVAGLILAWWAHWLRTLGRGGRWTYGWRAFTILAANLNGLLLVVAIVGVAFESIRRLFNPTTISEWPVLIVALLAALLNFATARLLVSGGQDDLNVRGAYLHMVADAAVSLAVVLGAVVMLGTGWHWLDPVISLAICVVLGFGTWRLLRESTSLLMHAAPQQLDVAEIRESLQAHVEIEEVKDLHVWSVSTTDVLLTARLRCGELAGEQQDALLDRLQAELNRDFSISHATLEIRRSPETQPDCSLENGKMRNILT